jgi:hypothetical protein
MSYGGSFQVKQDSDKLVMSVEMSAENFWCFIMGIHFLDGFVGKA